MARGKHTTPFRLYKRGEIYHAYISYSTSNNKHQNTRISTGCNEIKAAENYCLRYLQELERRARNDESEILEINTEDLFVEFFENKAQYYSSANDTLRKLNILKGYFNPIFHKINDFELRAFVNYYKEHNRANGTINRYLALLSSVITYAKEQRYEVPKINVRKYMLRIPAENVKYLASWDDAQRIIDRAPDHLKMIIKTALYTGMRLGNILNLKWEDVNFKTKSIEVKVKDRTKDGGKNFSIPMVEPLYEMLKGLEKESEYVFVYKGKKINKIETSWQNIFYYRRTRILRDESLPYINFHTLRHTAGTWLLAKCGNLKLVQQVLGHSDIKTTLKYAHVLDKEKRDVLNELYADKM